MPLMLGTLKESGNSLTEAALNIEPEINNVLHCLSKTEDVLLTRMSGSGATCFALYENKESCFNAAERVKNNRPAWW